MTPFGGLGVNTGMADAFDLGWKLAATIRGWGGPRLLDDSYDHERRLAALDLLRYQGVDFSHEPPVRTGPPFPSVGSPDTALWRDDGTGVAARRAYGDDLVAARDQEFDKPGVDLGYRYDGSPVVVAEGTPPPDRSAVVTYEQTSLPGGRAPHLELAAGGSILDLYGAGFSLVRTNEEVDASPFERAARDRRVPLRVESVPEAGALYDCALTLVRPDGFVAWRGTAPPASPGAIIDIVRGARDEEP